MKKEYMKPAMRVVKTQKRVHILAGSGSRSVYTLLSFHHPHRGLHIFFFHNSFFYRFLFFNEVIASLEVNEVIEVNDVSFIRQLFPYCP